MHALSETWLVLRRAAREAVDDRVPTTAQAVAYSLFLAIPAALLLVLGVFSLVADEQLVDDLIGRAETVMPEEVASLLQDSLQRTSASAGSVRISTTVVWRAAVRWSRTPVSSFAAATSSVSPHCSQNRRSIDGTLSPSATSTCSVRMRPFG